MATYVPPPLDVEADRFGLLSEFLEGDVLQPIWTDTPEKLEGHFGPGTYPAMTRGRFRYHWFLGWKYSGLRRQFELWRFYLHKGLELNRQHKYDCIVVYSHQMGAAMASLLKMLTGSKLVVEIMTSPQLVHLTDAPSISFGKRLSHLFSDFCLHASGFFADRFHLLSRDQLAGYSWLKNVPVSVFHDFVPVSRIKERPGPSEEPFVLLVGTPWYLKGVDLLLQAFAEIAPEFPGVRLKMLGYSYGGVPMDKAASVKDRIEILKAVTHLEAMQLIAQATVFVLPSRCEGLPRVLIEAMAAGVPVIASDVGGIPHLVRDGENGFLIPSGDAKALAAKLRIMLGDEQLRKRMGDEGYRRAHEELTERVWAEKSFEMVRDTVNAAKS